VSITRVSVPPSIGGIDREGILAVIADTACCELVRQALNEHRDGGSEVIIGTVETAMSRLGAGAIPNLLLIDLSASEAPLDDMASLAAAGGAGIKIIALGMVNDVGLFRDLIRKGATDYLIKPLDSSVLRAALTRATQRDEPNGGIGSRGGKLVAFLGTRGGVGVTTCAINAAWILAEERKQQTALIDLDLHFGTIALSLDIDPGRGLREALEAPSRIDELFIERAMVRQGDRLAILSAEEPVEDEAKVSVEAVEILMEELRQKFDWVLVDLPRGLTAATTAVLAAASHVVIVGEPTLAGLRDAIRLANLLKDRAPAAQLLVLEGGAGRAPHPQIGRADFEEGLGRRVDVTVPFDSKAASASANTGRALTAAVPASPAAKAVRDFVTLLLDSSSPSMKRDTFWRRILRKW
jgi:pilus assembly protein CpaE